MFDISPDKIAVFALIAFLVLGPDRLPAAARSLGRARAQLRELMSQLPPDAVEVARRPRQALLDAVAEPRQMLFDAVAEPRRVVEEAMAAPGRAVEEAMAAPGRAVDEATAEPRMVVGETAGESRTALAAALDGLRFGAPSPDPAPAAVEAAGRRVATDVSFN